MTLKSLLQRHSSKSSILQCSVFFMIQLSHLYMTTEKNHSFDHMDLFWQSDVSGFSTLFRFIIGFLPRNKQLLISRL